MTSEDPWLVGLKCSEKIKNGLPSLPLSLSLARGLKLQVGLFLPEVVRPETPDVKRMPASWIVVSKPRHP